MKRPRIRAADRKFRPEIQGLRALAVLMVVTYHVWFGRVSGGVDVFLFVSAFLMTLQFLRRHDSGGPARLVSHFLHVFRRLLPASLLVITATLVLGRLILPASSWGSLSKHGLASLFYGENWLLRAEAVDYYAGQHAEASPFQHFWSLSIQGQVFILWPLIFVGMGMLARRYKLRYRRLMELTFGLVFLVSLIFSIWFTATSQEQAYFDTFARLWEFALGSLVALSLHYISLSTTIRVILGWAGIVAMLACGFVVDVEGAFPGAIALWPTLAAAAVLIAGHTGTKAGVDSLLSTKPLQSLGALSYALYLWHWPLLVFALNLAGVESAGFWLGSAVIALSLALAYVTTRFIETPFRSWSWPEKKRINGAIATLALFALGAVPLVAAGADYAKRIALTPTASERDNPGALAFEPGYVDLAAADAPILPEAIKANKNWASLSQPCEGRLAPVEDADILGGCRSETAAEQNPDDVDAASRAGTPAAKTVMMVGHSHSLQYAAMVRSLAEKQGWDLTLTWKGGCLYTVLPTPGREDCDVFNGAVRKYIKQLKPDLVITLGSQAVPGDNKEKIPLGFKETADDLADQGIPVLAIRDNPRAKDDIMKCVQTAKDPQECDLPREGHIPDVPAYEPLRKELSNVSFIDLTDRICTDTLCPAIIGNVHVYMDANHLTATFAATLSRAFEERFAKVSPW